MALLTIPNTFTAYTKILSSQVNANFTAIATFLNTTGLTDANIQTGAAINRSKIAQGSASQVLINDGSGNFSSEAQLAVTRGGTGLGSFALGDLPYASAANTLSALAGNITASRKFLTQTGNGSISAAPVWGTIAAGDVPILNQNTTGTSASFTGNLTGDVTSTGMATTIANLARSKIAAGTANQAVINDGSGNLSGVAPGATGNVLTSNGTAWVSQAPALSGVSGVSKTAAYTLTGTDQMVQADCTTTAFALTLPAASSSSGKVFYIKKKDSTANAVTVTPNGTDTIGNMTSLIMGTQYDTIAIVSDGTSNWSFLEFNVMVGASYSSTAGTGINSSGVTIPWGTKAYDPQSCMNTSTGQFTVKIPGKYRFTNRIHIGANALTATQTLYTLLQKGGVTVNTLSMGAWGNGNGLDYSTAGSSTAQCAVGDVMSILGVCSAAANLGTGAGINYVMIERVGN